MDHTPNGNTDERQASHSEDPAGNAVASEFYCPQCRMPAKRPLLCGDCGSTICRECGSPLERIDDLGIG